MQAPAATTLQFVLQLLQAGQERFTPLLGQPLADVVVFSQQFRGVAHAGSDHIEDAAVEFQGHILGDLGDFQPLLALNFPRFRGQLSADQLQQR